MKRPRVFKTGKPTGRKGDRLPRLKGNEPRIETKSGHKVRSELERICANALHAAGIEFQYEPLMLLAGRQFRPDFFLPKENLFLEICGYVHMPHYRDRMEEKRQLYRDQGLKALFVTARNPSELRRILPSELAPFGINIDI